MEFREECGFRASDDLFEETHPWEIYQTDTMIRQFIKNLFGKRPAQWTLGTPQHRPDSISVQFPSNAEICGTSSSSGRPCSFRPRPSPSPLSRHMLSRALLLLSPPPSLSPPPQIQSLRTNREPCLIFFFVMKYYFYFRWRLKKFDHCHTCMTFETLKATLNQRILFIFFKSSR